MAQRNSIPFIVTLFLEALLLFTLLVTLVTEGLLPALRGRRSHPAPKGGVGISPPFGHPTTPQSRFPATPPPSPLPSWKEG